MADARRGSVELWLLLHACLPSAPRPPRPYGRDGNPDLSEAYDTGGHVGAEVVRRGLELDRVGVKAFRTGRVYRMRGDCEFEVCDGAVADGHWPPADLGRVVPVREIRMGGKLRW